MKVKILLTLKQFKNVDPPPFKYAFSTYASKPQHARSLCCLGPKILALFVRLSIRM